MANRLYSATRLAPGIRWLQRVLMVAALLPWLVLPLVTLARPLAPITPSGDMALLELGVIDALDGKQLLGPYCQYGFRHPGPLWFYLLAIPYGLGGATSSSAFGPTAAALNGLCIVALGLVWFRPSGAGARRANLWAAAVLGLLALYLGPPLLTSPWPPNITLWPSLLCLSACAAAAAGRVGWLAVATLAGSFCVQTHLSHAVSVGFVGAAALVWVIHRRRAFGARQTWVAVGASAAAAAIAWTPPLVEELTQQPGNLSTILSFAGEAPRRGNVPGALAALAARTAAPLGSPLGLRGGSPFSADISDGLPPAVVPVALVGTLLLGLALPLRVWRRPRVSLGDLRPFAAVAALASLVAAAAWASQLEAPVPLYLVRGTATAGALGLLALGPPWPRLGGRAHTVGAGLAAALLGLLAGLGAHEVLSFDPAGRGLTERLARSQAVGQAALAAARDAPNRRISVRYGSNGGFRPATATVTHLSRAGYELTVDPAKRFLFGPRPAPRAGELMLWVDTAQGVRSRPDVEVLWQRGGEVLSRLTPCPPGADGLDLTAVRAEPYLLEGLDRRTLRRGEHTYRAARGRRSRILLALDPATAARVCLEAASPSADWVVEIRLTEQRLGVMTFDRQPARQCVPLPELTRQAVHELELVYPMASTDRASPRHARALPPPPSLLLRRLVVLAGSGDEGAGSQ